MEIIKTRGFSRFLTFSFWKIQLYRLLGAQAPLNIVETFEIKLSDEEAKRLGLK